jgi:16S rRNA (guanine(527)-N(7))-methyltransferase RsmG
VSPRVRSHSVGSWFTPRTERFVSPMTAAEPPAELYPAAESLFGDRLEHARRYAHLLSDDAVRRGLIGPREAGFVWPRHILNCAVVEELVPRDARTIDVGSGAGLPGIPLALARPDLAVWLVESLERRVNFLAEVVDALGLNGQVRVIRGRAESAEVRMSVGGCDVVTARAVAPLEQLVRCALPLARPGGRLLALKGARAETELKASQKVLVSTGGVALGIQTCGVGIVDPPTRVVVIERATRPAR